MKNSLTKALLICLTINLSGCAVNKELVPTGGSRADGIVKLSYEYGLFEAPQLNAQQGVNAAKQRCSSWGYKNAEAFGGSTKSCIMPTNDGCIQWFVSIEYQCTEPTAIIAEQPTNPAVMQPSLASKASERMTYIKELKDKGLLNQDEYEVKRKEILKDL